MALDETMSHEQLTYVNTGVLSVVGVLLVIAVGFFTRVSIRMRNIEASAVTRAEFKEQQAIMSLFEQRMNDWRATDHVARAEYQRDISMLRADLDERRKENMNTAMRLTRLETQYDLFQKHIEKERNGE